MLLKALPIIASVATFSIGWWMGTPPVGAPVSTPTPPAATVLPTAAIPESISEQADDPGIAAYRRIVARVEKMRFLADSWPTVFEELRSLPPKVIGSAARFSVVQKHFVARMILGYWTEVDPAGAVNWVESIPKEQIAEAAPEIVRTWSRMDMKGMLDWLEKLPDEKRVPIVIHCNTTLDVRGTKQFPERVLAIVVNLPRRQDTRTYDTFRMFQTWSEQDPEAAAGAAIKLANLELRRRALSGVAWGWAVKSPPEALRWIQSLGDVKLINSALETYLSALSTTNPKAALEYVGTLPLTKQNNQQMQSIATNWVLSDPGRGLAWVESLKDEEAKVGIIETVIRAGTFRNPDAALGLIPKYAGRVNLQGETLRVLSWYLVRTKGAAGLNELIGQVPESFSSEMLKHLIPEWIPNDAGAFAAWSSALPDGEFRKSVMDEYGQYQALHDLPKAIEWANSLPVNETNKPGITRVARLAFFNGSGGISVAKRVYSPEQLSGVVEGWVTEFIYSSPAPASIKTFLETTDALSAEAKARSLKLMESLQNK